jgi:hypothetical protein
MLWIFGTLSFVVVFGGVLFLVGYRMGEVRGENRARVDILKRMDESERTVVIASLDTFSGDKLVKMLQDMNCRYPHIVYSQAVLESNLGRSRLFMTNNNLFGMKQAFVRPHCHSGSANNHAVYETWRESVLDYLLWACYSGASKLKSEEEYYTFLEKVGYAEAKDYVKQLKRLAIKHKVLFE